jgi:hypothetical protein
MCVLLLFDPEKPFQVFFPLLCIILRLTSAAAEMREKKSKRRFNEPFLIRNKKVRTY